MPSASPDTEQHFESNPPTSSWWVSCFEAQVENPPTHEVMGAGRTTPVLLTGRGLLSPRLVGERGGRLGHPRGAPGQEVPTSKGAQAGGVRKNAGQHAGLLPRLGAIRTASDHASWPQGDSNPHTARKGPSSRCHFNTPKASWNFPNKNNRINHHVPALEGEPKAQSKPTRWGRTHATES